VEVLATLQAGAAGLRALPPNEPVADVAVRVGASTREGSGRQRLCPGDAPLSDGSR
jgi:hypothetical protein